MRLTLTLLALATFATDAAAGPFRRWVARPVAYTQPSRVYPANGYQTTPAPSSLVLVNPGAAGDSLDELNAKRVARGLRPYIRDDGLTLAARAAATFRARHGLFGHVMTGAGDFQFLPVGVTAAAAGCSAYPAADGFLACAMYDGYTFAGAVTVQGADGRAYHHLFVR